MIKSIVFLALLSVCSDAFVIESSYEKAYIKAIQEGKPLVVFLTKRHCQHCNDKLAKIMHNEEVSLSINKYAIFVIVTQGQKESYPIEMFYTTQYPALFILDNNELPQCGTFSAKVDIESISTCINP